MPWKCNVMVGEADVSPDAPAHTPGVRQGNAPGGYEREPGQRPDGRSTARRSTGISASRRNPITPGAPVLSPA
jgi:hypothetical protein